MSDTYKCAACDGVFEKEWSDDEAMDESRDLFGDVPQSNLAVVCDDCFKAMSPMWEADDD